MDEVTMIGALLDEGGPTRRVTTEGREGLDALMHSAATLPAAPPQAAPRRDGRRLGGRRPFGIGLGLVAVGSAAAVAIAVLGSGGAPGSGGSSRADGPRRMVLAAAVQAERQTDGRFLVMHTKHCHAEPVRARTGDYIVQPCHETWEWRARDRANDSAIWTRELPTRPQTPRDTELWKRAGSPSTFPYHEAPDVLPDQYRTRPTLWKEDPSDRDENPEKFLLPGTGLQLTARELRDLPTDPKQLERVLSRPDRKRPVKRGLPIGPGQRIVEMGLAVDGVPLPPKVWAAFIRMLADTPGVRAVGRVTDPMGRPGVALEGTRTGGPTGSTSMERIIFDPRTGALLAVVATTVKGAGSKSAYRPGTVESYKLFIETRWTDTRPTTPPRD
ncbi:MAG TPA: CU044_5270 family protein [Thermomonospora sp.]|nr:CU044_5270 family protein [Thermomonospora sp.]